MSEELKIHYSYLYNGSVIVIWKDFFFRRKGSKDELYIFSYMSNEINHNEYDALGDFFRRRLENHQMLVDGNGWKKIESRLLGKQKKSKAATWLWTAGAVAAAVALLLMINHPTDDETLIPVVSQQVIQEEKPVAEHQIIPVIAEPKRTESMQIDDVAENMDESLRNNLFPVIPEADMASNIITEKSPDVQVADITAMQSSELEQYDLLPTVTENSVEPQPDTNQPVVEKVLPKLDISLIEDKPDEESEKNKTNQWMLAAAFSTGSSPNALENRHITNPEVLRSMNHTYNNGNTYIEELRYMSQTDNNNVSSGISNSFQTDNMENKDFSYIDYFSYNNNFSYIDHRPPLSFGVKAYKSIGKHGGIQSGITYTYLSSRFDWSGYYVLQNLHYIGVPVNMVVYLWDTNPNWRIYLSGGFMLEKGIKANYRFTRRFGNEKYTTIVNTSIDGLQWSLNSALGINYRLSKGFGIYLEPQVGYCFDNDQPASMRTEWPFYIGVNMGLNFEF